MRKKINFIAIVAIIPLTLACKGGDFENKVSSNGSTESHNAGQNCMACNSKQGGVEGWFETAGTVYSVGLVDIYENTAVKLYTGPNGTGTLKYTLEGDAKGNFYTTKTVKYEMPLYPSVTGTGGTKFMSTSITTGNCMSCHGLSTSRIWAQ